MKLDWDDLRFFWAVARHGSTKRAAAALHVDQTTCARRIASLEAMLGNQLFERRPTGYALAEEGRRLQPLVEEMAKSAEAISSLASQSARGRQTVLRLSVGDLLVEPVVRPALARFRKIWPDVRVDLAVETRYVDIMNGEADVAIRPGAVPDDPNLIVRRLGDNPVGVYCTEAYAKRYGMPSTIAEHLDRPFACMEGRALDMITRAFPDKRPSFVVSTLQPLVDAVVSGDFAAILPCIHADRLPGLMRCVALDFDTGSVWLVYHPELRRHRYTRDFARNIARAYDAWAKTPQPARFSQ